MFVIDFDDTLFDTHAHKALRLLAVQKEGVSEEDYWTAYKMVRKTNDGFFINSDDTHAHAIAELGYDYEKIKLALGETTTPDVLESLCLPGAKQFIAFLKTFGEPLILLSLGDPEYQEKKVKGICIDSYFDRMFMVNDTKLHVMREIINHAAGETIWFINDKVQETREITDSFPNVRVLMKKSPNISEQEYIESGFSYCDTIPELQLYIEEHHKK